LKHIVIIGGGIAGLGAAYKVRRAADAGVEVTFTLVEKDDRLGGKIFTDIATDPDGGTYIADGGSDAFLTDKTALTASLNVSIIFFSSFGAIALANSMSADSARSAAATSRS
jgi:protoporphyrinogen oxidase